MPEDPNPIPDSKITHAIQGWRKLALWPLALVVRCWCRSLRFEMTAEDQRALEWSDQPVAFVLWHNRLFITAEIFRRYRRRPLCALVSASRDGAWLAAFFSLMGMSAVRGSSSRFGREAGSRLAESLRGGLDIGITPDGPRGPCYDFKPGALIVARRAHAPLLLLGAEFPAAWRLRSWDGFYLPRPFSIVQIRCERVAATTLADREEAAQAIAERLRSINPDRRE